jgi:hypothetical protein
MKKSLGILFLFVFFSSNLVLAQEFLRGDSNENGNVDISDAIFTLNWIFRGAEEPSCWDSADANDDSQIDISDVIYTLLYLFREGPSPPSPYYKDGVGIDSFELMEGYDFSEDDLECLRSAEILEVPIFDNSHCLRYMNRDLPECDLFYNEFCFGDGGCSKDLKCPRFYNPVYDKHGIFYPSACWAEELGVTGYEYGYSEKVIQFIRDLWKTPRIDHGESYYINRPEIVFNMGSGKGVFFRSSLWNDEDSFSLLDYDLHTTEGENQIFSSDRSTFFPVLGERRKMLLAFVMFDSAYPEGVLIEWTKVFEEIMNDYLRFRQEVNNPIQYEITPIIIDPPKEIGETKRRFSPEQVDLLYDSATSVIGDENFETFVISSIWLNGFGGLYSTRGEFEYIEAPLTPLEPYSSENLQQGLNSFGFFGDLFSTISHEILHAAGLPADHTPLGGVSLSFVGVEIDQQTGRRIEHGNERSSAICDFFATSEHNYGVEIPEEFAIHVGEEPNWLFIQESESGNCALGLERNVHLKDIDLDGIYEMMYSNNIIGGELQRFLGWTDVDGNGVTELLDEQAYGGNVLREDYYCPIEYDCVLENGLCTNCNGDHPNVIYSFPGVVDIRIEVISEIEIGGCLFNEIELHSHNSVTEEETVLRGLFPLRCEEFNTDIINIYEGADYSWIARDTEYGKVLHPRLS